MLVYDDGSTAVVATLSNGNGKVCGRGPLTRAALQVYYLPARASLDAAGLLAHVATVTGRRGDLARAVVGAGHDTTCPDACPHRSAARGGSQRCYVVRGYRSSLALSGILNAYVEGRYPTVDPALAGRWAASTAAIVRLGAYGDPTAAPIEVARALTAPLGRWTGYTAAWRTCDPTWRDLVMASTSSLDDTAAAQAAGWRTYRVRSSSEPLATGERVCPAAKEAPTRDAVSCATCRQCDGTTRGALRPSFAIIAH